MSGCTRGVGTALVVVGLVCAAAGLSGAALSRQQADSFARKITVIDQYGDLPPRPGGAPRRTSVTESELNSWFAYRASPLLPEGLTEPQLTIIGNGKVSGAASVDLEAVGKRRGSGGMLDLWSYLGGRVPITVAGVLHTANGRGRFELEQVQVSGVPVPKSLLQELLTYYSRSQERPQGLRLEDPFDLPARIHRIEVGQGQAVVVQ